MAIGRFHANLRAKIDEEMNKAGKEIILGRMLNHEVYREAVGYIRGLAAAIKLAEDVEMEIEG
jgi:hypothetical protein